MVRRTNHRARSLWAGSLLAGAALVCLCHQASSQVRVVAGNGVFVAIDDAEVDPAQRLFLLPSGGSDFKEALQDFHRYVERAAWEKAFKSLDAVRNSKTKGLVSGHSGLQIPLSTLIQQTLAELPAAGKDAYRLFHDAEAKKLLDDAKGEHEVERLAKLTSEFLITGSGDVAADRLGDIYFEMGDFRRATDAWQAVVRFRPDSKISPAYLLIKCAIAMARAGDAGEFADLSRLIEERYATDVVVLGGNKMAAQDYLRQLSIGKSELATIAKQKISDIRLPKEPSDIATQRNYWAEQPGFWQFRVNRTTGLVMRSPQGRMWINGQMIEPKTECPPAVATDQKRLYGNLLGWMFALDLESGKLLWNKGKLFELHKQIQQQSLYADPDCFTLGLLDNVIWTTTIPLDQFNRSDMQTFLFAYDADTGNELFNSQKPAGSDDLKKWNFLGRPLLTPSAIYALAVQGGQGRDLTLLAIDPQTRKLQWSTPIGAYKQPPMRNYRYGNANSIPLPQVTVHQGKIYVETGLGVLTRVVPSTHEVEWGMLYDCAGGDPNENNFANRYMKTSSSISEPQFANGLMYFKGARSTRMYCLDTHGPQVLWKRPVSMDSRLLCVDDSYAYLMQELMEKIDLKTQKLVAPSQALPGEPDNMQPLITENYVFVFTPRGIFQFNRSDLNRQQAIFRGADTDSNGGVLIATSNSLLAISSLGITSYPLVKNENTSQN